MEKSSRRWMLVIVLVTLILGLRAYSKQALTPHTFFDVTRPLVIAHRGGMGLRPENTLMAFRHAARLGVDVLELDVHASKDNVLVVIHDDSVDRTTDGVGKVSDKSWKELSQLDAAYRWLPADAPTDALPSFRGEGVGIPALTDVLTEFPALRFNIEIKPNSGLIAQALCAELKNAGMEKNVLVASAHVSAISDFREQCPTVATATAFSETVGFFANHKLGLLAFYQPRAKALEVPVEAYGMSLLTKESINAANRQGQHMIAWTINDQAQMQHLLNLGVSGLISDYPDRMLAELSRMAVEARSQTVQ